MNHNGLPEVPTQSNLEESKQPSMWRQLFYELLETVFIALVMVLVINFVSARIRVDGNSMQPSFEHNDYVIVSKLSYTFGEILRGDVVVFPFPHNPDEDYIKRVIGLPGEEVEIRVNMVYINGQPLDEDYVYLNGGTPRQANFGPVTVPEGHLFLLGDNRNQSSDSRYWGCLDENLLRGKAEFIHWSWDGEKKRPRLGRIGDILH